MNTWNEDPEIKEQRKLCIPFNGCISRNGTMAWENISWVHTTIKGKPNYAYDSH